MLNRNGKSEHPCPAPDFRGKALFLTIEYDAGCGFFHTWPFIMSRYVLSRPTLQRVFLMNGCCTLSNTFLYLLK